MKEKEPKEYRALWVSPDLHYKIKVEALKHKLTIIELLELWTKEQTKTK
jgi:hypothetical protein